MKKLSTTAIIAALLSSAAVANAGDFAGANTDNGSSNGSIEIGESTVKAPFNIHNPGFAGVGINSNDYDIDKKVDFRGLKKSSKTEHYGVVNQLHKPFKDDPSWWEFHKDLGSFNFIQAGTADVWFGEWSEDGSTGGFTGRQVYYIGDRQGTSMQTSGKATYTTYGLNKFKVGGGNLMTGTLTADFDNELLTGHIKSTGKDLYIDANIDSSDASFDGSATFNSSTKGDSYGHFFGNQASSLAGIAEFDDSSYDTAFGGTKNP